MTDDQAAEMLVLLRQIRADIADMKARNGALVDVGPADESGYATAIRPLVPEDNQAVLNRAISVLKLSDQMEAALDRVKMPAFTVASGNEAGKQ